MMIIGCDFHPRFQQIAYLDLETGELVERRLMHTAEAEEFYRSLKGRRVRVGVEATGNIGWIVFMRFIKMLVSISLFPRLNALFIKPIPCVMVILTCSHWACVH